MANKLQVKTQSIGYSDFYWNRFSPRVATISSIRNANHWDGGFITYIAFPTKVEATAAMKYLLLHQKAGDVDMRKAKRMKAKGIRWELKIRGLAFNEVLKFATMDITGKLVISPENISPENISPENISPENISPDNISPDNTDRATG